MNTKVNYGSPFIIPYGIFFGLVLIWGKNNWVLNEFVSYSFSKLNPIIFLAFGFAAMLLVYKSQYVASRSGLVLALVFGGVIGGYIGIGIWNLYIGDTIEFIDFMCTAWVEYVFYFISANTLIQQTQQKW